MDLWVTFIGTAASVPTAGRGTSATLVVRGGSRVLIDCGEGTQRQFLRSGLGLVDLDAILLTHLHGDHYLGLPGLLKTYGLRGRTTALPLIGPPGLHVLLAALGPVIGRLPFALEVREVEHGPVLGLEGARWEAFATQHSVRSLGYALIEEARPGMFDLVAARALGVPAGPLFGQLQRGETIAIDGVVVSPDQVLGEARAGRRVVVTGDTEPCDATREAADRAELLVHEATFLDEDRARARETHHSTAREAGAVARDADVRLLALTHVSSRFLPREVRKEAESQFPATIVPRDFDQVEIPFAERGAPIFHPGGATRRPPEADPPAAAGPGTVTERPDL
jgi:ribonuclease Z